ncbi:MAG TPA: hypothetical protein VEL11_01215 [Candidatus Bathyarchaeia archaeon]|nr:hypothetical protein [Candidatus Bathyarchaeia archaeon]
MESGILCPKEQRFEQPSLWGEPAKQKGAVPRVCLLGGLKEEKYLINNKNLHKYDAIAYSISWLYTESMENIHKLLALSTIKRLDKNC